MTSLDDRFEKAKNWLIKKLGGYTKLELTKASESGFSAGMNAGIKKGLDKRERSPGWLRQEIHSRLNQLFPGKEFDKARYRWLRSHTMTTSHMSEMKYEELKMVCEELGQMLKERREQYGEV